MKILKIFGLVVGIHVVAFMFVFAIPGCRSMSRHSPPPTAAVQAEHAPTRPEAAYPQNDAAPPIASTPSSPAVEPALNPGIGASSPGVNFSMNSAGSTGAHANPTRPGSATPTRVNTAPVAETPPVASYVVVAGDSLSKIAKKHNLSSKELAAANNLRPEAPLRLGQKIKIPGAVTPMSSAALPSGGQPSDTLVYKVKAGDSLAVIAKRAGTTTAAIRSLNHLKNDTVRVGQELTLPAGATAAASLASPAAEAETPSTTRGPDGSVHHIVKSGENLGIIARHYGVKSSEIAVANNIADPLKVRAGQDLIIPSGKIGSNAHGTTAQRPLPQPPVVENTPATTSSSPVSSPVDANPIAPSPAPSNPSAPPTIEVQETNPIATPKP